MSMVLRADVPGHAVNCYCAECRAVEATREKIWKDLVLAARHVVDGLDASRAYWTDSESLLNEALTAYDAWGKR